MTLMALPFCSLTMETIFLRFRTIQDRLNKRIVHVGFKTGGNAVRSAAWSHVTLSAELASCLSD